MATKKKVSDGTSDTPEVVDQETVEAAPDSGPAEVDQGGAPSAEERVAKSEAGLPDREEARAEVLESLRAVNSLESGASGEAVERLQKSLGLEVTGKFDRRVVNAVRRFQSGIGATPTGRVDSATWRALGI